MESIYWFLIVLFGIYLSIPILSLIINCISKCDLRYFIITAIVTISIFPFVNSFIIEVFRFEGNAWNTALELPILGSYMIFPLLGYWASVTDFDKKMRKLIYILAVVMVIFRYEGLKLLSERDGMTNQLFMNYKSIPSVLFAIGVFVFFKYNNCIYKFGSRFKKLISQISSCSFGVYLIHNIILSIMSHVSFFEKYSFQWYFIWPFICYLFCVSLVWLCKNNRLMKWVFP